MLLEKYNIVNFEKKTMLINQGHICRVSRKSLMKIAVKRSSSKLHCITPVHICQCLVSVKQVAVKSLDGIVED